MADIMFDFSIHFTVYTSVKSVEGILKSNRKKRNIWQLLNVIEEDILKVYIRTDDHQFNSSLILIIILILY